MLKVPLPSPLCETALSIVDAIGLLQAIQWYGLECRGLTGLSPRHKIKTDVTKKQQKTFCTYRMMSEEYSKGFDQI